MQVGSLVECIDNYRFEDRVKLKTPYLITGFVNKGDVLTSISKLCPCNAIYLEGVNHEVRIFGVYADLPFPAKCFRELLPPINIEQELEQENLITS